MKSMKASAVLFLIFFSLCLSAQNLIGYKAKEITTYMAENHKDMSFQDLIYNSTFKYLKYTDKKETQTLLFFLTSDSLCKSVRLVCDKSLESQKIKELDSKYKKSGENLWIDSKSGKKYIIELKEEEWSFSVTIRLNE